MLSQKNYNIIIKCFEELVESMPLSTNTLLDKTLEHALKLTSSQVGYIYFYDDAKKEFMLNSWSKGVMQICSIINPQTIYQLEKTGIWGEAVRQNKPVIVNDFQAYHPLKKGYPEGHAPLYRFLSIPVHDHGNIAAVIGVGNKKNAYEDEDILKLQLLMSFVWKIVGLKLTQENDTKPLNRYKNMFSSCSMGIALYNEKEQLIESNPSFNNMLFFDQHSSIKRKNIESLHHLFALFSISSEQKNDLMMGKSINYSKFMSTDLSKEIPECDFNYSKGHRCLDITVCPFETAISNAPHGYMVQMVDFSRQKYVELMKNEFVSTVSHEFRTPLTIIKGAMDIISMKVEVEEKDTQQCIHIAKRNITRLENLISDILDFQQFEHEKADHCYSENCINDIVKESVSDLESQAQKKGLTLNMKLDAINPSVYCKKDRIVQVLINLISNAIKFTHQGSITVATKNHHDDVMVSIKDTGIGISPDEMPILFNFFTQLKHVKSNGSGGSGLGLAISKKIIENHQGKIWVNSIPNEGSTFFFSLPGIAKEAPLDKPKA